MEHSGYDGAPSGIGQRGEDTSRPPTFKPDCESLIVEFRVYKTGMITYQVEGTQPEVAIDDLDMFETIKGELMRRAPK